MHDGHAGCSIGCSVHWPSTHAGTSGPGGGHGSASTLQPSAAKFAHTPPLIMSNASTIPSTALVATTGPAQLSLHTDLLSTLTQSAVVLQLVSACMNTLPITCEAKFERSRQVSSS